MEKKSPWLYDKHGTRWLAPIPGRETLWRGTDNQGRYYIRTTSNPPVLLTGIWDQ
jgi:hypothetical protein